MVGVEKKLEGKEWEMGLIETLYPCVEFLNDLKNASGDCCD